MMKVILVSLIVGATTLSAQIAIGQPQTIAGRHHIQLVQNSSCYSACAGQEATCERGCNAAGGSMEHVQACLVRCEQGQEACAARCR